jgi:ADP-ribosylation factor family
VTCQTVCRWCMILRKLGNFIDMSKMLQIWDLGGQASLRSSWHLYFNGVDAIIVVVDSSDRSRIPIAKQELYQILATRELENVPLLLLANKQVRQLPDCARGVLPNEAQHLGGYPLLACDESTRLNTDDCFWCATHRQSSVST